MIDDIITIESIISTLSEEIIGKNYYYMRFSMLMSLRNLIGSEYFKQNQEQTQML